VEFGAVVLLAAHTDFDDEFSGVRMFREEVILMAADDREVRFRLRIAADDGLLLPNEAAWRLRSLQRAQQALGKTLRVGR